MEREKFPSLSTAQVRVRLLASGETGIDMVPAANSTAFLWIERNFPLYPPYNPLVEALNLIPSIQALNLNNHKRIRPFLAFPVACGGSGGLFPIPEGRRPYR